MRGAGWAGATTARPGVIELDVKLGHRIDHLDVKLGRRIDELSGELSRIATHLGLNEASRPQEHLPRGAAKPRKVR